MPGLDTLEDALVAAQLEQEPLCSSNSAFSQLRDGLPALAGVKAYSEDAADRLGKLRLLFSTSTLGQWLGSFEQEAREETALPNPQAGLLRMVTMGAISPMHAQVLPPELVKSFLTAFPSSTYRRSCAVARSTCGLAPLDKAISVALSDAGRFDVQLTSAMRLADYEGTIACARAYGIASGGPSRRSLRTEVAALTAQGDIQRAIETCSKLLISNPSLRDWIPFDTVASAVPRRAVRGISRSIYVPIFFAACAKHRRGRPYSFASYSTEDFLEFLGCTLPSQAQSAGLLSGDVAAEINFLAEVCAPNILRLSTAYADDADLENERITICRTLARIDPDNSDAYEQEARDLVRGRIIRDALRELDGSKIAIDEDALRAWARRNLASDFTRYQALLASGLTVADASYKAAIIAAMHQGKTDLPELSVPDNDASALFVTMVERFFHECSMNPEHGIDCYLSVRVRHGTVSGSLRGPAEKEHIVTRTAAGSSFYKSNLYWMERLRENERSSSVESANDALRQFSGRIDNIADELIENQIQVNRPEKPKGLLVLNLSTTSILVFSSEISEHTDFDAFIDRSFDWFWSLVNTELVKMRDYIDGPFRRHLRSAYSNLEKRIERISSESQFKLLADSVRRARKDSLASVDEMMEWFTMPRTPESQGFTLSALVDVSKSIVTRFYPDFTPNLTLNFEDDMEMRGVLRLFSDIFFIIFSNVYWHASKEADVTVSTREEGDKLIFRVENSVPVDCLDGVRVRFMEARDKIESGAYKAALPKQGGTGLLKLAKLAKPEKVSDIQFGLTEECRAFVQFPFRIVRTDT